MAVEARLQEIVADKWAARQKFKRREQAARLILDGLDGASWFDIAGDLGRKLTEQERVSLLMCVIKSLPDELTAQVIEGMFEVGIPTSGVNAKEHRDAASLWAEYASPAEIKAFVHAGINAMPPETRAGMRDWLNKGGK